MKLELIFNTKTPNFGKTLRFEGIYDLMGNIYQ